MNRSLLDLVRELNTLNDDNLSDRVIANNDVQGCLSELQDILEAEQNTLTPPNEPLTCDGCISLGTSYGPCMNCIRSRLRGDMYRRPPEG